MGLYEIYLVLILQRGEIFRHIAKREGHMKTQREDSHPQVKVKCLEQILTHNPQKGPFLSIP